MAERDSSDYLYLLGAFSGVTGTESYTPSHNIETRITDAFAALLRSGGIAAAMRESENDGLRRRTYWRDFADTLEFPSRFTNTLQIMSGLRANAFAVDNEKIQVALVAFPDMTVCKELIRSVPLGVNSLSLALARAQEVTASDFIVSQAKLGVTREITDRAQINAARIKALVRGFTPSK